MDSVLKMMEQDFLQLKNLIPGLKDVRTKFTWKISADGPIIPRKVELMGSWMPQNKKKEEMIWFPGCCNNFFLFLYLI